VTTGIGSLNYESQAWTFWVIVDFKKIHLGFLSLFTGWIAISTGHVAPMPTETPNLDEAAQNVDNAIVNTQGPVTTSITEPTTDAVTKISEVSPTSVEANEMIFIPMSRCLLHYQRLMDPFNLLSIRLLIWVLLKQLFLMIKSKL
jgi:hypothetical protein